MLLRSQPGTPAFPLGKFARHVPMDEVMACYLPEKRAVFQAWLSVLICKTALVIYGPRLQTASLQMMQLYLVVMRRQQK